MDDEVKMRLVEIAKAASQNAYVPYSRFRVGAALLVGDGSIYTGCNIENSSYPATVCAERVAMHKAISEGKTAFEAIAVSCDSSLPCSPCGICRQVMAEFAPDMLVLMVSGESVLERQVRELLPCCFGQSHLTENRNG